ncbi:MAG: BMP family ABC transporter substrate-binding protein, partial [Rubrobacter sp.]|nr:BMP family ABC transporter substrate-binding protein [Rubrobacter sp.]
MRAGRFGILTVLIAALLALAAACGGAGGGGGEQGGGGGETEVRPAMVTDVGGLGDQSFNDSAYRGLKRAGNEFGVKVEVLESNAPTDYVSNLSQLAESGYSPVFAVGFLMTDAVTEVS